MLFALLAKLLLKQHPLVQAVVLGLCTGLFVTALADANERDPAIGSTVRLVLIWGAAAASLFYVGFAVQRKRGRVADHAAPDWLYAVYAIVWVFVVVAALFALFGEGGFKVAALAIVPLVLLAPTALYGIRMILHRAPAG